MKRSHSPSPGADRPLKRGRPLTKHLVKKVTDSHGGAVKDIDCSPGPPPEMESLGNPVCVKIAPHKHLCLGNIDTGVAKLSLAYNSLTICTANTSENFIFTIYYLLFIYYLFNIYE